MIISNIVDSKLVSKIKNNSFSIGEKVELNENEYKLYTNYISKLNTGYPLDYLIGEVLINGMQFNIPEGVFIPRPCTEKLTQIAEELIKNNQFETILDVCSGTGLISITLALKFPNQKFIAFEIEELAYKTILENIKKNNINNIEVIKIDALNYDFSKHFNTLLLCNPPYVPEESENKSVVFEPKIAIYSGEDGLTFFNKFIKLFTNKFPSQFIFELDPRNVLEAQKHFENIFYTEVIQDDEGFNRFVVGKRVIL